jgi:hypothetical protein
MVSEPSTPGAYLAPSKGASSVKMDKTVNLYLKEGKDSKINNLLDNILRD